MVEALPFLLLGVLFSSVLLLFVDERRLVALVPKHPLPAALVGSFIGFLFPVCECGNVPVAHRLIVQGGPYFYYVLRTRKRPEVPLRLGYRVYTSPP